MSKLEIKDLHVGIGEKEIVKGLNLEINAGEIHAIMGPNGGGKSTLSFAIMGHPKYNISKGDILLNGESIKELTPDKRANKGLFLSFQYPSEVSGVKFSNFIKTAINARRKNNGEQNVKVLEFMNMLKDESKNIGIDSSFTERNLNEGFSGGEKKKGEILQMAMLKPKIAILDETDSGLDIDALKIVAENIKKMANNGTGILVVTHYQRILEYLQPDYVHIFVDGKIVKSGDKLLAKELEKDGYGKYAEVIME